MATVKEAREALGKPLKHSAYLDALEAFVRAVVAEHMGGRNQTTALDAKADGTPREQYEKQPDGESPQSGPGLGALLVFALLLSLAMDAAGPCAPCAVDSVPRDSER